jgi:hypothetical protein
MKWTVLLLAAAATCSAQDYSTGQAARHVIGQKPFTAADPGTSDVLLGSVGGVAFANDTLIVADSNGIGGTPINHRVLIYRNVSSFVPDRKAPVPQSDTRCPACRGTASVVLGQPDFVKNDLNAAAANTLRKPIGVAYNGRVLAVADTDNNRVLIWKSLPTVNQQNADLVVGQKDFTTTLPGISATSLRGPQGLWLDANNGLWVCDTGNSRVLYFGEVTANNQAARFALGQTGLDSNQQKDLFPNYKTAADTLLNPTGVTSDGTRLFVADLGGNRVLIWNSIPNKNAHPADVVIGQPDLTTATANNSAKLCPSNGTDEDGNATYPMRCEKTIELPRAVLTDGRRLFIADGGNDRVLIYNSIPTTNGVAADLVIGQPAMGLNQSSDSSNPRGVSATDSFRTPISIATDGVDLFVADTYNRRVLVYTPGDFPLPLTAVRNAPSPEVYARGSVTLGGTLEEKDDITIKIGLSTDLNSDGTVKDPAAYKYTTVKDDTTDTIIDHLVDLINAGPDPNVLAVANKTIAAITLIARKGGIEGNNVTLETLVEPTDTAKITATVSGANLAGGQDAAQIAPGALVTVLGEDLTDNTVPPVDLDKPLPTTLGGVEFYIDGLKAPLVAVSPNRILAQLPVETNDATSSSGVLRVTRSDGSVRVSTAVAIPVIPQNPSVFSDGTLDPKPGLAYHFSSQATGTVSVDGTARAGDIATVVIRDREYSYTINTSDSLTLVRDNLIAVINANDPEVEAFAAGPFQRIRLRARVPGPEGNTIPFSAKANNGSADSSVIMSAFNTTLCCANEAGAPVTDDNPAVPGETIVVLASGLGLVNPQEARDYMFTGQPYDGPALNDASEFVSALAGGKTANVLFAGLRRGAVGIYEVHLELNTDLPTNPKTEATIAQSFQVSNIFTIPVVSSKPPQ